MYLEIESSTSLTDRQTDKHIKKNEQTENKQRWTDAQTDSWTKR